MKPKRKRRWPVVVGILGMLLALFGYWMLADDALRPDDDLRMICRPVDPAQFCSGFPRG